MSQLYNKARELFATGQLDWTTEPIRAALVEDTHVFDEADEFLISILPDERIAADGDITSPVATDGYCSSDTIAFTGITPTSINALVFYINTGNSDSSTLIAYMSFVLPAPTTDTGDYVVAPDPDFGGFFRI